MEEQNRTVQNFVLGFRSLVVRLVPFERGGTKRAKNFLAMESGIANFSATMVTSGPLREGRDGKCEGRKEKCEFLARESVNSSPILARQWWRHFRLSLYLSLSLSLSLSPKVPHAQYRKRFCASYNTELPPSEQLFFQHAFEWDATFVSLEPIFPACCNCHALLSFVTSSLASPKQKNSLGVFFFYFFIFLFFYLTVQYHKIEK